MSLGIKKYYKSNLIYKIKVSLFGSPDLTLNGKTRLDKLPISQKGYDVNAWTVHLHAQAEEELKALPADMQARFLRISELLQELGPQRVGLPHIRPLEGKLWEMRMQGRDGIARAVYVAVQGRRLMVLHLFVKKTQTTPRSAIETARRRMETLL